MRCQDFVDHLLVYYEGSEGTFTREALDRHAAGCMDCRNFLRTYEATLHLGAELYQKRLDPRLEDALSRRLMAAIETGTG
jgi:hypothetical protein